MRTLLLLLFLHTVPLSAAEPLRIAVASNFKPTLETLNAIFIADSGMDITLSPASTGVLASQIRHGAPFDLFFAADKESPRLVSSVSGAGESFCYAHGRLVLAGGELSDLTNPERSVAIANPDTAPYGRAAMAVLARGEFAAASTRKLVRGASVAQAYQFWHSGAVDLALLPLSLAPEDAVTIPATWHPPIEQHALVVKRSDAVTRYLNWFRSDTVRSLISEAGYDPCP